MLRTHIIFSVTCYFANYTNKIDEFEYFAVHRASALQPASVQAPKLRHGSHSFARYDHMKWHDLWALLYAYEYKLCSGVYGTRHRGHTDTCSGCTFFCSHFRLHSMATATQVFLVFHPYRNGYVSSFLCTHCRTLHRPNGAPRYVWKHESRAV